MLQVHEELQKGVERLLESETFRNAPTSRRLLKYLLERSVAGDADQLKEYTIGVDAFGKAEDYDPRQDSTVRIQIGRLRQKLAEYYREEGRLDATVIDLPKGRFRLVCEARVAPVVEAVVVEAVAPEATVEQPREMSRPWPWRMIAVVLAVILVGTWIGWWGRGRASNDAWSADLEQLWQPLLAGGKPLVVAVGDPLFAQFRNKTIFRDPGRDKWEDLMASPQWDAVRKAVGGEDARPVRYYAAFGEVQAAFLLGQRLGPRHAAISLVPSSQLNWQQMADANVVFLGPPRFFGERLGSLPMTLAITESADGFVVASPGAGEQALYPYRDPAGYFAPDGEACVLVSHVAGPAANTDVLIFASNSTFARMGAVSAFTEPRFARLLAGKFHERSAAWPRYFQVLLRVKYKGGVPTETSYLLHRELRAR